MNKKPIISLIMPVYNEERFIGNCLKALTKQDLNKNSFEVVIADGNSTDNTKKIIKTYSKKLNINLLRNPKRNTASGRNICVKNSSGKYLLNYSGHAIAEKNLLSTLINLLDKSDKSVGGVGCANYSPTKQNWIGKSIGVVMLSVLGGVKSVDQNINFKTEKEVRSLAFCAYKKEVFKKAGVFDEKFWVGQDGELNLRVRKAGYKIIFTPKTKVYLYKRPSIKTFVRQMYRYGVAANNRIKKHPDSKKITYYVPSLFVLYNFAGIFSLFFEKVMFYYPLSLLIYVFLGWLSSFFVTKNPIIILISPLFYFLEHFSYGLGFMLSKTYKFR